MSECDLHAAAAVMAELVGTVSDDQLTEPTPCPDYSIGDLVDHIGGFAMAFTWAANKEAPPGDAQGPSGDASRLTDDWRRRIPTDLVKLAAAWKQPEAWTGMTQAGGIDLPGEIAGIVALDELVIHGWDLAPRRTSRSTWMRSLSTPLQPLCRASRPTEHRECSAPVCRCLTLHRCSIGSSACRAATRVGEN